MHDTHLLSGANAYTVPHDDAGAHPTARRPAA